MVRGSRVCVAAVVPAAGKGRRLGASRPKAFVRVLGKPLFIHTLRALLNAYPFREVLVAVGASHRAQAEKYLRRYALRKVRVVPGGATRAASVRNALLALSPEVTWVAVHDAARPLVSRRVVRTTIAAALKSGGAICAVPVASTVKRVNPGSRRILRTEDRRGLALAQTPQVFGKKALLSRYRLLGKKALGATDEAALFDGGPAVRVVPGDEGNIKITTQKDLEWMTFHASRNRL